MGSTHNFQMKYFVVRMALQDPLGFFSRFNPDNGLEYFTKLWTAFGEKLEPQERIPSTGADAFHRTLGGDVSEELILTYPAPASQSEAYFVGAFLLRNKTCRVFGLERSLDLTTKQPSTVLAEFMPHGRANWGPGRGLQRDDFVSQCEQVIGDPRAGHYAFTSVRLA
jgi:hypothetical protein